jgi:outer membrane protein assembly factor BamB
MDPATGTTEWQSDDLRTPFWGLGYGDLEGDGGADLVHSTFSSDGSVRQGRFVAHDWSTGSTRILGSVRPGPYLNPMWDLAVAEIDGDAPLEVLTATGWRGAGTLTCYDGRSGAEQWRATVDGGLPIRTVHVADVDADGELEVVAGTELEAHSSVQQLQVYVFDARSGRLEWKRDDLGNNRALALLDTGQLDDDPALEIVVGARFSGEVFVLDGRTGDLARLGRHDATAVHTLEHAGGRSELWVGTSTGDIRTVDPVTGTARDVMRLSSGIGAIETSDLDGDTVPDHVVTDQNRLHVVDGLSRRVVWSSEILGASVGTYGSLLVADVDRDGRLEVAVSNGSTGIDVFEVRLRRRR